MNHNCNHLVERNHVSMIRVNEQRLIDQFFKLIQIDSETKNEYNIAQYLKEKFQTLGLKVSEDDSKEKTGHGSGNLICDLEGDEKADPIFFTAHMDTVTPGKNIKPTIKNGYVVSDGSTILGADDKAGLAALIEFIHLLKENNVPHGPIQIIITVGEESGLVGSKNLNPALIKAKYGYALDSDGTVGDIVVQAPAQAKILTKIIGKAAHAGVAPEKGVSAITVAAKAVSKIPLGRIDEETTANIGYFRGGQEQTNIVCDYVEILAEARSLDEEKLSKQINVIKETFENIAENYGARALVTVNQMYPSFKHTSNDQVVKIARQAAKSIGRESSLLTSGGGSDANIFSSYGIPTVNLAVGYEEIHTTDEKILVSNLVQIPTFLVAIIQQSIATYT